jgi:2',3'-cyclic-nucleotide 2'-phosphodiesterase (5'-nucleotidase family)
MTSKSGVPMYAYVQNLGGILNSSGNASLGDANLEDVFTNGYSLSTDVDKKSITFGDQLID